MATRVTSPSDQNRTAVTLAVSVFAGAPKDSEQAKLKPTIKHVRRCVIGRALLHRSEGQPAIRVDELLQFPIFFYDRLLGRWDGYRRGGGNFVGSLAGSVILSSLFSYAFISSLVGCLAPRIVISPAHLFHVILRFL